MFLTYGTCWDAVVAAAWLAERASRASRASRLGASRASRATGSRSTGEPAKPAVCAGPAGPADLEPGKPAGRVLPRARLGSASWDAGSSRLSQLLLPSHLALSQLLLSGWSMSVSPPKYSPSQPESVRVSLSLSESATAQRVSQAWPPAGRRATRCARGQEADSDASPPFVRAQQAAGGGGGAGAGGAASMAGCCWLCFDSRLVLVPVLVPVLGFCWWGWWCCRCFDSRLVLVLVLVLLLR